MVYKPNQTEQELYADVNGKVIQEKNSETPIQEQLLPPRAEIYASSLKKFRAINAGEILNYYNTKSAENLFSVEYAVIQQVLVERAVSFSTKENELEALLKIANKILNRKKNK